MAWLGLGIIIVIMVLVARWFIRKVGCDCDRCAVRMARFSELSPEEQSVILSYFREAEKREPDTAAIFVCRKCGMVYDDFSGEMTLTCGERCSLCKVCAAPRVTYLGLAVSNGALWRYQEKYPELIERFECLRCQRDPSDSLDCADCDTDSVAYACCAPDCRTLHVWQRWKDSRFRFLVPLTDQPVLKDAPKM